MLMASTTNADSIAYDAAPDLSEAMKKEPYSLMIRVGWTFSGGGTSGKYALKIKGQSNIGGEFSNGVIIIKNQLHDLKGEGELVISLTNGPSYRAKVTLGSLPKTQTVAGLARRLTNLGFYAGTDGTFNGRMAWAVRAFKRVVMNKFTRNSSGEVENNCATKAFLTAVRNAFGVHPGDSVTGDLSLSLSSASVPYCGMFGNYIYYRGSFENAKIQDDIDQEPANTGIWEGVSAADKKDESIAGEYEISLCAFDSAKESPFGNRINLPQPIRMVQFVLFELGYLVVCGEEDGPMDEDNTRNRQEFIPDGWFGHYTQWAVREFQYHAKYEFAAKEDINSAEAEFLSRIYKATGDNPPRLTGDARYPDDGKIDGQLNEETRKTLQAWADGALRYLAFAYASEQLMQSKEKGV
jgi:hypothetical protein